MLSDCIEITDQECYSLTDQEDFDLTESEAWASDTNNILNHQDET